MLFVTAVLFLILFYLSVFKLKSEYFTFFSFLLFLGIVTKYLILNWSTEIPVFENIGKFQLADQAMWANAIRITTTGLFGITTAAVAALALQKKKLLSFFHRQKIVTHSFFLKGNKHIALLAFFIITISFFNYRYSMNFIGIKSSIDSKFLSLIWAFLINHGLILITTYFVYFNFDTKDLKVSYILIYLAVTCAISSSRLSRSFIFCFAPVFYAICTKLKNANSFTFKNQKKLLGIFSAFVIVLLISTKLVNELRDYKFKTIVNSSRMATCENCNSSNPKSIKNEFHISSLSLTNEIKNIAIIFITRFIGLEGVLASAAYDEASNKSLLEATFNNITDNVSYYDQHVIKSNYQNTNSDKVKFGTLPGLIGFMAISGNYFIIFLGCFLVTLIGFLFELTAKNITDNFIAKAYFSGFLALSIAQFGFQPLHVFVHFLSIILFLICIEMMLYSAKSIYTEETKI